MKSVLKKIAVNTVAIAAVAYLTPGLSYRHQLQTLLIAAFVLAFVNTFLKPFLKILFLPINVITLGLLGWLVNVVVLYITTFLVPGFTVQPFTLDILNLHVPLSLFWAYVAISFILNLAVTAIAWVFS